MNYRLGESSPVDSVTVVIGRSAMLEFRILGPLEAVRDGRLIPLGGAKQRTLLAALLLRKDQAASTNQLIDELWDQSPPSGARGTVHRYVRRLRTSLQDDASGTPKLVLGDAFGYRIDVRLCGFDLHQFDLLAAEGRGALARDDPALAAEKLRAALALWRGRPLDDVPSEPLRSANQALLIEKQLAVLEDRIEADLRLGRQSELIGELPELVRAHPARERLNGQLMLALFRADRQTDALRAYQDTRRLLIEEHGVEPSRGLRELQHAIVNADPALNGQLLSTLK